MLVGSNLVNNTESNPWRKAISGMARPLSKAAAQQPIWLGNHIPIEGIRWFSIFRHAYRNGF
jgi:hypothetical protein